MQRQATSIFQPHAKIMIALWRAGRRAGEIEYVAIPAAAIVVLRGPDPRRTGALRIVDRLPRLRNACKRDAGVGGAASQQQCLRMQVFGQCAGALVEGTARNRCQQRDGESITQAANAATQTRGECAGLPEPLPLHLGCVRIAIRD
ncbi:MAG: hypothetical protein COZ47_02400 [Lysobacterales bacterium CG_4_10_14_3_um_filter_64_11]|nr:MAG: hypothetical protein COZ47_02400 [Xanthomonadales bacterium CG_4_10_14_3_um_filter_64_11]